MKNTKPTTKKPTQTQNAPIQNLSETIVITIDEFCKKLSLVPIFTGTRTHLHIHTSNISRPGLFLSGFHKYFACDRVQVIGEQETAYLNTLSVDKKSIALDALLAKDLPCVILSSGIEPCKSLLDSAKKHNRIVLTSNARSTVLFSELNLYLSELLAPCTRMHGVLLDVYGMGVLITGASGVGKSETTLELLGRNHQLVADDAVNIKRIGNRLVGTSPASIRHFMEVRGLGVIDISLMYGASSIVDSKDIDIVINLEDFDSTKEYDRLGAAIEYQTILEKQVPKQTIPVKSGRNVAVVIEVAVRNFRLKSTGHDALQDLMSRVGLKK